MKPIYFKIYDTSGDKEILLFAGTFIPETDMKLSHEQHHAAIMHLVKTTTKAGDQHDITNTRIELLSEKAMGIEMDRVYDNKDTSEFDIVRVVCPICYYLQKAAGKDKDVIAGSIKEKLAKLTAHKDNKLQMEACEQHEQEAKEQHGIYVMSTTTEDVSLTAKVEFLDTISGLVAMNRDLVTIVTGITPTDDKHFIFCGNHEIHLMIKGRKAVTEAVDIHWDEIGTKIKRIDMLAFYLRIKTAVEGLDAAPNPKESTIPSPSTNTFH